MKKLAVMIMVVLVLVSLAGAHAEASAMNSSAITESINAVRAFHAFERSINENMTAARISSMGPGSIAINLSGMEEGNSGIDLCSLFGNDR